MDNDDIQIIQDYVKWKSGICRGLPKITENVGRYFANPQWNVNQVMDLRCGGAELIFYPDLWLEFLLLITVFQKNILIGSRRHRLYALSE